MRAELVFCCLQLLVLFFLIDQHDQTNVGQLTQPQCDVKPMVSYTHADARTEAKLAAALNHLMSLLTTGAIDTIYNLLHGRAQWTLSTIPGGPLSGSIPLHQEDLLLKNCNMYLLQFLIAKHDFPSIPKI
jgi:hypothetical protein